jgi:hypothetical protein
MLKYIHKMKSRILHAMRVLSKLSFQPFSYTEKEFANPGYRDVSRRSAWARTLPTPADFRGIRQTGIALPYSCD